jgi:protein tyrosine phosphatase (PTP) superfamily phosphohydrolase (DUF442 family)
MSARRVRKRVVRLVVLFALAPPALFLAARLSKHNFAEVDHGRFYRSAQMPAEALGRVVRAHGIRTVLNLRGSNPASPWYRAERAATLAAGATLVDVHMASDMWLSRAEARTLLDILDTCEYPVLVHCQWGAERTGLVSAISRLLRPDSTLGDARGQFSLYYLYVKAGDGAVMERHLDQYEHWLKTQGANHSPARFRRWLASLYIPGHPNRGEWPFDPYPSVIISHPTPTPQAAARIAGSAGALRK